MNLTQTPRSTFHYGYDPRSRRYRNNATGRYVSPTEVRGAVDTVIDAETVKIRELATSLVEGKLSLADWQMQMAANLKTLHVAVGLAANGGLKNTSAADLGWLASQVKAQYAYLRTMTQEIRTGKQALDGTLVARSALYTQAARGTYEQMVQRLARNGGMKEERRLLGIADHCQGCLEQAQLGWQSIGTLLPIGGTECRSNCRCSFSFR